MESYEIESYGILTSIGWTDVGLSEIASKLDAFAVFSHSLVITKKTLTFATLAKTKKTSVQPYTSGQKTG
jgi:hypothetical protein